MATGVGQSHAKWVAGGCGGNGQASVFGKMVATSAASGLSSLTSLADLANLTSIPAPSMLMPDLTALQMDGAQVLPEVEQAMAQIQVALSEVSDFSVSLSPAPSKVLDIQSAMSKAGSDAQAKLSSM